MYKAVIVILLVVLLIIPKTVLAEVSIGIWPAGFEINAFPFKTTRVEVYLFNPSNTDVNARVEVYCKNCERDVEIFNFKVGSVRDEVDLSILPSFLTVEKNTSIYNPKVVTLNINNRFFIKSYFKIPGSRVEIPFYTPILDRRDFDLRIVATTETKTLLSITGEVKLRVHGINTFLFLAILFGSIFFLGFVAHERYRKLLSRFFEQKRLLC